MWAGEPKKETFVVVIGMISAIGTLYVIFNLFPAVFAMFMTLDDTATGI